MFSISGVAAESSPVVNEFHKVNEPEAMAELSAGALEEYSEAECAGNDLSTLIDDQCKVMDIQEDVEVSLESGGLTPQAQRILKKSLTTIVGQRLASARLPAMENFDSYDRIFPTQIALEGIVQTIKDFWTAIKNQATSFWNKTKGWFIKTFDVSNKIISRAKAIQQRTDSISTSAKENSFEFSGISFIAVDYQVKDPNICISGFEALNKVMVGALDNLSKDNSSNKTEVMLNKLKTTLSNVRNQTTAEYKKGQQSGQEVDIAGLSKKALSDWFEQTKKENPLKPQLTNQVQDQALAAKVTGGDNRVTVLQGDNLPGNRTLFATFIDPGNHPNEDVVDIIKSYRMHIADTSAKPKEMESTADVKTLNVAQINKIGSIAEDLGEMVLKYKKEFEARDRYLNSVIKGFDSIMRELEGSDVALESADSAAPGKTPLTRPKKKVQNAFPQNNNPQPQTPQTSNAGSTQAATTPTPAPAAAPASEPAAEPESQPESQETDAKEKPEVDNKAVSEVDKQIKRISSAMLGLFRRDISYQGKLITIGVKSANAFLAYAEKSLAQYGA